MSVAAPEAFSGLLYGPTYAIRPIRIVTPSGLTYLINAQGRVPLVPVGSTVQVIA